MGGQLGGYFTRLSGPLTFAIDAHSSANRMKTEHRSPELDARPHVLEDEIGLMLVAQDDGWMAPPCRVVGVVWNLIGATQWIFSACLVNLAGGYASTLQQLRRVDHRRGLNP